MNNIKIKGVVSVKRLNKDTLEVIDEQQYFNVFSAYGFYRIFNWAVDVRNYIFDTRYGDNRIYLGLQQTVSNPAVIKPHVSGTTIPGDQLVSEAFVEGSPSYYEAVWRFNPSTSTRTIHTIMMGPRSVTASPYAIAYTSLETPCVQETTEILEVTYRIQTTNETSLPAPGVSVDYAKGIYDGYFRNLGSGYPSAGFASYLPTPQSPEMYSHLPLPPYSYSTTTNPNVNSQVGGYSTGWYKSRFTPVFELSHAIGRIIRTMYYGRPRSSNATSSVGHFTGGLYSSAWTPIANEDFPNKPVQPIHNHNATATSPFLDVDHLATSTGTLSVNGDGWTNPDWPKFFRVEYTQSGAVGNSRYYFRKRPILGFEGGQNNYRPTCNYFAGFKHNDPNSELTTLYNVSPTNDHGLSTNYNTEPYSVTKIIMWDNNGIIIQDQEDGEVAIYDNNTTPALIATDIQQCARDQSGNVYIACSSTGLHKISDPFGTPNVTTFANSTHGVPVDEGSSADVPRCYGVAQGFNGRIWAVFNGALSWTDDEGVSWTNYTPISAPAFDFTGITNGNWNSVKYIVIDKQAASHHLAIVRETGAGSYNNTYQVVWFTPGDTPTVLTSNISNHYKTIGCSSTNHLWTVMVGQSTTVDSQYVPPEEIYLLSTYRVKFNDSNEFTAYQSAGTRRFAGGGSAVTYVYDYYGNPVVMGEGSSVGNNYLSCYQPDGEKISHMLHTSSQYYSYGSGSHTYASTFDYPVSPGLMMSLPSSDIADRAGGGYSIKRPHVITAGIYPPNEDGFSTGPTTTLNYQHTILEEVAWKKYHWNGASWANGYYADAVDTATFVGGPYGGTRHNFDTESHYFTGRSLIDISSVFAAGNFTNNVTVVAKLIPDEKLNTNTNATSIKLQEYKRTIFEIADTSTNQRLSVLWSDKSNNIVIEESDNTTTTTHTITATPINGGTYRLAVSVTGTSLNVYLDGTLAGSATLSSLLDLSNTTGDIKCYVGARCYLWDYQRMSPMPGNFYRGTMENIQLWNIGWDATDASTDASNIDGVINTQPVGNMVARYELTQSLSGLETKATHAGAEALDEGLTIGFNDGITGTSFVATDYHTFGVVDGILKDNATTFTHDYSLFFRPTEVITNNFTNTSGTNTVPSTGGQITEPLALHLSTGTGYVVLIGNYVGQDNTTGTGMGTSVQQITGDGFVQCTPSTYPMSGIIGLSNPVLNSFNDSLFTHGIRMNGDGTLDLFEGNSLNPTSTNVGTWSFGDSFKVSRSGTTVTYEKITNGVPTVIHTSSLTSTGTVYAGVKMNNQQAGFVDCFINYTRPAYTMAIGNPNTFTGVFDPDYMRTETDTISSVNITLDGVPATPIDANDEMWPDMPIPAPGQVVVNGRSGHLVFNSADAGKTVAGTVLIIKTK